MADPIEPPKNHRAQGWKVKIYSRERLKPPHLTLICRDKVWRIDDGGPAWTVVRSPPCLCLLPDLLDPQCEQDQYADFVTESPHRNIGIEVNEQPNRYEYGDCEPESPRGAKAANPRPANAPGADRKPDLTRKLGAGGPHAVRSRPFGSVQKGERGV